VVFPAHPRTSNRNALPNGNLTVLPPASYVDFISLVMSAALVVTDSGGVQEETSFLGVPCLTVRPNTERPITVALGSNRVIGCDPETLEKEAVAQLAVCRPATPLIPLWDGHAADRIASIMEEKT
jgi:UDP-N-acetylglucosamine 2-epimerase (non-hydrolysing)